MNLIDHSKKSVKEFSEETFLANAKLAFQLITESFTKGDISNLKKLLIPELYASCIRCCNNQTKQSFCCRGSNQFRNFSFSIF